MENIRRIYVEKRPPADTESIGFFLDMKNNLGIKNLESARIANCYDVMNIDDETYAKSITNVFTEPPVDVYYENELPAGADGYVFGVRFLPGLYDQRADWAEAAIRLIMGENSGGNDPKVVPSKFYVLKGKLNAEDIAKIKSYVINPVDSMEMPVGRPTEEELYPKHDMPSGKIPKIEGFISMGEDALREMLDSIGLAMSFEDIKHTQRYFADTEKRNPTITEIKVLDTYWSDHCRHTTFLTNIESVEIEEGKFSSPIKASFDEYVKMRKDIGREKSICLMDIAQMGMRWLKAKGILKGLDESEEINACSIKVTAMIDGKPEDWLVMFKNETHNHPTEIEPFGGAATCLGGAIRDPLSGRAYVYQAMRVTGSGDPRTPVEKTLKNKLPQRKITLGAAAGYSSYGNQIGLSTGLVQEVYDEGYVAKRMEIGAVIGAVKEEYVVRERPEDGDIIILLGGATGRDGCGGATGSSKVHTDVSLMQSGAEVQKGNPPTERKIQRLFRNPDVTKLIKRCNDFGAGGVSVAIGELADGLEIDLNKVPLKYNGLSGTEIAISESQERMAVCVKAGDVEKFIELAVEENLEAVAVALVNNSRRLVMKYSGENIVDISRDFLDTNGAGQFSNVYIEAPKTPPVRELAGTGIREKWLNNLKDLNVCAQKGLVERFDSTIGSSTVLMPFGGKFQFTPAQAMAAKLPVIKGDTTTATLMSYGFDPKMAKWSPYHGAMYAVVDSIAKIVAAGGNPDEIKLTFQEYFERLKNNPVKWGKPFAALLGALSAQIGMNTASIGGKDSMSGSFNDLDVPPSLVSFALAPADVNSIISAEFKQMGSAIATVFCDYKNDGTPDFDRLNELNKVVHNNILNGNIISAHTIGYGGIGEALSKMAFGNRIGFDIEMAESNLFSDNYGGFVFELSCAEGEFAYAFEGFNACIIGKTTEETDFIINGEKINHFEALTTWLEPLESAFNTNLLLDITFKDNTVKLYEEGTKKYPKLGIARPKVFIPVFPGTNCEYDTAKAFEAAGAEAEIFVIKSFTPAHLAEAGRIMADKISSSQILAIPGGFSAADEPEGSGKFIAAMFRNELITEAINKLLNQNDGLAIGICNGFQTLIKLGLLTHGEIRPLEKTSPTLTFNEIGRHVSCIVNTKIISNKSPWLGATKPGEVYRVAISHGEGRFVADEQNIKILAENGQIATQYVDFDGNAANCFEFNPNGSAYAIEGITSPDGRVFGKMGHTERFTAGTFKNVPGEYDSKIFVSGVKYFG